MGERVLILGSSPAARALARALRRAGAEVRESGPESLSAGIDPAITLVFLALPLRDVTLAVGRLRAVLPPGAVLVDLSPIMLPSFAAARDVPELTGRFVSCHPVLEDAADRAGEDEAAADPFTGATVFVGAPLEPGSAAERVARMWRALGANPEPIAPTLHDALVALTHHLPILAAAALTRALRRTGSLTRSLAPGARSALGEATRAAAGPAGPAAEALAQNAPKLLPALEILEREVRRLRHSLEAGGDELRTLLEEAREFRRELVA